MEWNQPLESDDVRPNAQSQIGRIPEDTFQRVKMMFPDGEVMQAVRERIWLEY